MTASLKASLAAWRPAISSHLTLGFSTTIASAIIFLNFWFSSSPLSPPEPPPLCSLIAIGYFLAAMSVPYLFSTSSSLYSYIF